MEQTVIFEDKVYLTPKDMNRVAKDSIDTILMEHLRTKLENKCSQHGFVLPGTLEMLSRSFGRLENGRFTGNIVFNIQAQGSVYNPANGTQITGAIAKKNKMGLYIIHEDAIRVLVPRDLHIGNDEFEALDVGQTITVTILKSRFQINDPFILSVGRWNGTVQNAQMGVAQPEAVAAPAAVAAAAGTVAGAQNTKSLVDAAVLEEEEEEDEQEEDEQEEQDADAAAEEEEEDEEQEDDAAMNLSDDGVAVA
jgi:hypothetical protein